MAAIPLHVKLSLLNNYIQADYLKSRGKAKHDDFLIGKILESVKTDLEELEKSKNVEQSPVSMELVLRDLKYYSENQSSLKSNIGELIKQLNSIVEQQEEPQQNLEKVIKDIEEISRKDK